MPRRSLLALALALPFAAQAATPAQSERIDAIYADLAKPFAEQSMDIRHAPVTLELDLYKAWGDAQQG